jgi:RHS repeat-associated protein
MLLPDQLGSVIGTVYGGGTLTSFAYRSYGKSASTPAQFGYTGQRSDAESGNYYYRARHYSPALGRFLQADPIGHHGGMHLYAYTDNDPLNAVDPDGLILEAAYDAVSSGVQQSVNSLSNTLHAMTSDFEDSPGLMFSKSLNSLVFLGPEFQQLSAAVSSATSFSAIGSTGQVGEQWLANNLGGTSGKYFSTSQGARYVDQFANGIANESKVGYTSLTTSVQSQISKDVELMQTQQVGGVNWHFFNSPVTGLGGPSQPLLNSLQQNGINVILH